MKNFKIVLIATLALILLNNELTAQRKRTNPKKSTKEKKEINPNIEDKFIYDIRLGNIGINQGFSLSAKPGIGYKLLPFLNAGVGSRLFYDYLNFIGTPDQSYFSYGGFAYARGVIANRFYLQGEYGATRFDFQQETVTYPSLSLGYMSQTGVKWSYGVEISFPLNDRVRDYSNTLEYWLNFSYNLINE